MVRRLEHVGRPETERRQETWKEAKKETRKRKGRGEDKQVGEFWHGVRVSKSLVRSASPLSARLHRERTAGMRMNRLRDDPLPR